jgi:pyrroline-5-carboxylate reductase
MAVDLLMIGGGKMGSALMSGLVAADWAPADRLGFVEPDPARRQHLERVHPGVRVVASLDDAEVAPDGGVVLAVKPDRAEMVCRALGATGTRRLLSVVAGLPSARLEAALPDGAVVIRAMPNMPALIGAGITAISGGSNARSADLDWAEGIVAAVGRAVRVPERDLDAVTGLSGSGPAYVFLVAEALIEAGVLVGLSRDLSRTLAVETLLGSAKLLAGSGEEPAALRAAVTSPGGTTAAGLRVLESRAVRSAVLEAVVAATERARNLAR